MRKDKITCAFICVLFALLFLCSVDVYADDPQEEQEMSLEPVNSVSSLSSQTAGTSDGPKLRVLFVGNSFTKQNKQRPGKAISVQLRDMAAQTGKNIEITTIVHGGTRLRHYAGMGMTRTNYIEEFKKVLANGKWDYVVLQDYSGVPVFSVEEEMLPALDVLTGLIRKKQPKAKILLYQTHGFDYKGKGVHINADTMQRRTAMGYFSSSLRYGLEVVPAGNLLSRAARLYPEAAFLAGDKKHPEENGYFVLAMSFYYRFFGKAPIVDPAKQKGVTLTAEQTRNIALLTEDGIAAYKTDIRMKPGQSAFVTIRTKSGEPAAGLSFLSSDPTVVDVNGKTGGINAKKNGTAVICATAANGCQAFYRVRVTGAKEEEKEKEKEVQAVPWLEITTDKKQPRAKGMAALQLTWGRIKGVKYYYVYKSEKEGGPFRCAAIVDKSSCRDEDVRLDRKYYYYVLASYEKKEPEKGIPKPECGIVVSVSGLRITEKKAKSLTLTWNITPEANGYRVYRSEKKKGSYRLMRELSGNQSVNWTDNERIRKKTYYYKIVPYRNGRDGQKDGKPSVIAG